jgi:hypothetical protein
MKATISVVTLGVGSVQFYREGLGLSTPGITGSQYPYGAAAHFESQSGLTLALWPKPDGHLWELAWMPPV